MLLIYLFQLPRRYPSNRTLRSNRFPTYETPMVAMNAQGGTRWGGCLLSRYLVPSPHVSAVRADVSAGVHTANQLVVTFVGWRIGCLARSLIVF